FLVPANPELGTFARRCFPLRQGADTLGYLWLIDKPRLTAADIEVANEYGKRIVLVLAAARKATTEAARRSEHVLSQMLQAQTAEYCRALARQSSLPSDGIVTLWSFELKAVKHRSQWKSTRLRITHVYK